MPLMENHAGSKHPRASLLCLRANGFQPKNESEEEPMNPYFIMVGNTRCPVSEQVYRAYYQSWEHERYLEKKARSREIPFSLTEADCIIDKLLVKELLTRLGRLNEYDWMLIFELFILDTPERELARKLNLPRTTLRRQKDRILKTLRQLINF
jgi:hypothetical protein